MKDRFFLGIDGGGTKTLTAVSNEKGRILSVIRSGPSNFQSVGIERAYKELKTGITKALKIAKLTKRDITFGGFGISGADRDKDFDIILSILNDILPDTPKVLVNDTTIALRAGTKDCVGVAIISGTGTNCIGFNKKGIMKRVGGLGPLTGDYGAGSDIAMAAYHAAFRYNDGRGPYTILYDIIKRHFRVNDIEDLIELTYYDSADYYRLNTITPYVFIAARKNDRIAKEILINCGKALSRAALTCLKYLFRKDEEVNIAFGGSVFIKQPNSIMTDYIKKQILKSYTKARFVILKTEPVIGALLLAYDRYYGDFRANSLKPILIKSLKGKKY
jgi:N-acetylglucosamine kinase-like BadF-type ATPase